MKVHLKLSAFLLFCCLTVHGRTISSVDSIPIPAKVMELPQFIKSMEPLTFGQDRAGSWALPTLVALRYGLIVNDTLDERFDDEKAAQAATAYLVDLFPEFGDWDLCYVAYLSSPAYLNNFQARYPDSIPEPKAVAKLEEHKPKPAPKPKPQPQKEPKYITYTVKSGDTLGKIAKKYHVTVADIKKWNNLKSDFIRENQKLKIKQ